MTSPVKWESVRRGHWRTTTTGGWGRYDVVKGRKAGAWVVMEVPWIGDPNVITVVRSAGEGKRYVQAQVERLTKHKAGGTG